MSELEEILLLDPEGDLAELRDPNLGLDLEQGCGREQQRQGLDGCHAAPPAEAEEVEEEIMEVAPEQQSATPNALEHPDDDPPPPQHQDQQQHQNLAQIQAMSRQFALAAVSPLATAGFRALVSEEASYRKDPLWQRLLEPQLTVGEEDRFQEAAAVAQELCLSLQLEHPLARRRLLRLAQFMVQRAELRSQLAPESFDADKPEHKALLAQLWDGHNRVAVAAPGGEPLATWEDLGFQTKDRPHTDFRGAGTLGLRDLLDHLRIWPGASSEIVRTARAQGNWFPYACTGINITATLLQNLDSGRLDPYFMVAGPTREAWMCLYAAVFERLHRSWIEAEPENIFAFPQLFRPIADAVPELGLKLCGIELED